jgi:hypothetical protein
VLALLGWSEGFDEVGSVVLRLGMDWADAKRHIAKRIRIANRHEGTAPGCFLCRARLTFSFIEKISKHPFNFIMGRKAKYVHFMYGNFPSPSMRRPVGVKSVFLFLIRGFSV